ncbi:hypothetical protein AAGS61_12470 [Lysinibacillus sp. KU-BSD001]|uniref:hypothetical protein n=1 Tax=Lysinibacillus sp. KU-BSD001 TaxID=3141328 RepID=UPI0036E8ADF3
MTTPTFRDEPEKFRTLEGYWIEPIENLYNCNPLVKNLGEKNINAKTLIEIHSTLADAIIQEKTLTPNEFINAFAHLIKSNNHNKATFLLTHILKSLDESDIQKDYWSLTDIWVKVGLPKELDDDIAYLLKAQQIITRAKFKKPIEKLLREFHLLVKERVNKIRYFPM